jgi:ATP-dependent DNA ligase
MPTKRPTKLQTIKTHEAVFIEPMECLLVSTLPDGPNWIFEIKLDGYRAIAVKSESFHHSQLTESKVAEPKISLHR